MDTQTHTGKLDTPTSTEPALRSGLVAERWGSFSPQTRHKPKTTRTYTQGFLRVSAHPLLVAKTAPKGRFFP
jgi:hypothetical protein